MTVELPTDPDHVAAPAASLGAPGTRRSPARERSDVPTPDLVGTELLAAYQLARAEGLRLSVSVRESKIGPWGQILSQTPAPGVRMRPGSRVQIIVSGRPHVVVPDVQGLSVAVAADELARLGLQPDAIEQRRSRSVAPGCVISTSPRIGSLVPHGSRITIVLSMPSPAAGRDQVGRTGSGAGSPVGP